MDTNLLSNPLSSSEALTVVNRLSSLYGSKWETKYTIEMRDVLVGTKQYSSHESSYDAKALMLLQEWFDEPENVTFSVVRYAFNPLVEFPSSETIAEEVSIIKRGMLATLLSMEKKILVFQKEIKDFHDEHPGWRSARFWGIQNYIPSISSTNFEANHLVLVNQTNTRSIRLSYQEIDNPKEVLTAEFEGRLVRERNDENINWWLATKA